jgi:hypothetical protein
MQRVALQFWHVGAARKKADREAEAEARRRLHQKLFPRAMVRYPNLLYASTRRRGGAAITMRA